MDNNIEKEAYFLMMRFENLSEEGQKAFLKELFVEKIFGNYINNKVETFKQPIGREEYIPSKQEVDEYKETLVNRINNAVDPLLDSLYSDDEEFKCRIFEKFIKNYCNVAKEAREGICGDKHDFSKWVEEEGTIPSYDENGEVTGFGYGVYRTRKCYCCGKIEKVYPTEDANSFDNKYAYWEEIRKNSKKNSL